MAVSLDKYFKVSGDRRGLSAFNLRGKTPLMLAASTGNFVMVNNLLWLKAGTRTNPQRCNVRSCVWGIGTAWAGDARA